MSGHGAADRRARTLCGTALRRLSAPFRRALSFKTPVGGGRSQTEETPAAIESVRGVRIMFARIRRRTGTAAGAVAAATVTSGCSRVLPTGATMQAQDIAQLWQVFLLAGLAVAAIVYALLFWCLIAYRRRGAGLPPQFRKNVPLELTYTLVPILVVAWLFWLTYSVEIRTERVAPAPAVRVRATGFQWSWRFEYVGTTVAISGTPDHPPALVLPVGQRVQVTITSIDVAHSFYVPAFLFKRDAIPGLVTQFDWTLASPGTYLGECAEYCGVDHAFMDFTVNAVPAATFRRWLHDAEAARAGS